MRRGRVQSLFAKRGGTQDTSELEPDVEYGSGSGKVQGRKNASTANSSLEISQATRDPPEMDLSDNDPTQMPSFDTTSDVIQRGESVRLPYYTDATPGASGTNQTPSKFSGPLKIKPAALPVEANEGDDDAGGSESESEDRRPPPQQEGSDSSEAVSFSSEEKEDPAEQRTLLVHQGVEREAPTPAVPTAGEGSTPSPAVYGDDLHTYFSESMAAFQSTILKLTEELEREKVCHKAVANELAAKEAALETLRTDTSQKFKRREKEFQSLIGKKNEDHEIKRRGFEAEMKVLNDDFIALAYELECKKRPSQSQAIPKRLASLTKMLAERDNIISSLEEALDRATTDADSLRRETTAREQHVYRLETKVSEHSKQSKRLISLQKSLASANSEREEALLALQQSKEATQRCEKRLQDMSNDRDRALQSADAIQQKRKDALNENSAVQEKLDELENRVAQLNEERDDMQERLEKVETTLKKEREVLVFERKEKNKALERHEELEDEKLALKNELAAVRRDLEEGAEKSANAAKAISGKEKSLLVRLEQLQEQLYDAEERKEESMLLLQRLKESSKELEASCERAENQKAELESKLKKVAEREAAARLERDEASLEMENLRDRLSYQTTHLMQVEENLKLTESAIRDLRRERDQMSHALALLEQDDEAPTGLRLSRARGMKSATFEGQSETYSPAESHSDSEDDDKMDAHVAFVTRFIGDRTCLKRDLRATKTALADTTDERDSFGRQLEDAKMELARTEAQFKEALADRETKSSSTEGENRKLKLALNSVSSQRDGLQDKVEVLEANIYNLTSRLKQIRDEMQMAHIDDQTSMLRSESSHESDFSAEYGEYAEELSTSIMEAIEHMKTKLEKRSREIEIETANREAAEIASQAALNRQNSMENKIETLDEEVRGTHERLTKIEDECAEKTTALKEKEETLQNVREHLKDIECGRDVSVEEKQEKIAELEAEILGMTAERDRLQARVTELEREATAMTTQMDLIAEELDDLPCTRLPRRTRQRSSSSLVAPCSEDACTQTATQSCQDGLSSKPSHSTTSSCVDEEGSDIGNDSGDESDQDAKAGPGKSIVACLAKMKAKQAEQERDLKTAKANMEAYELASKAAVARLSAMEADHENLERQCKKLKEEVATKAAEIDEVSSTLTEKDDFIQREQGRAQRLQSELQELNELRSSLEDQLDSTKSRCDDLSRALEERDTKIEEVENSNEELDEQVETQKALVESLEGKVAAQILQLEQDAGRANELEDEIQAMKEKLESAIYELRRTQEDGSSATASLEETVKRKQEELDFAQEADQERSKKLSTLEETLEESRVSFAEMQSTANALEENLKAVEQQNKELATKLEEAEILVVEKQEVNATQLERERATQNALLEELEAGKSRLKEQADEAESMQLVIADLEKQLKTGEQQALANEAKLSEAEARIEEERTAISDAVQQHKAQIEQIEEKLTTVEEEKRLAWEENENVLQFMGKAQASKMEADVRSAELQDRIDQLVQEKSALADSFAESQTDVASLREELQKSEDCCEGLMLSKDNFAKELGTTKRRLNELSEEIQRVYLYLDGQRTECYEQSGTLKEQLDSVQCEKNALRSELDEISEAMEELESTFLIGDGALSSYSTSRGSQDIDEEPSGRPPRPPLRYDSSTRLSSLRSRNSAMESKPKSRTSTGPSRLSLSSQASSNRSNTQSISRIRGIIRELTNRCKSAEKTNKLLVGRLKFAVENICAGVDEMQEFIVSPTNVQQDAVFMSRSTSAKSLEIERANSLLESCKDDVQSLKKEISPLGSMRTKPKRPKRRASIRKENVLEEIISELDREAQTSYN